MLTVLSVVSFTTGAGWRLSDELPDGGEACSSLLTMLAAAFCSTTVGIDWSGQVRICPIVSFGGEKEGVVYILQPELTCSARCLRWTTAIQLGSSQWTRRAPKTLRTYIWCRNKQCGRHIMMLHAAWALHTWRRSEDETANALGAHKCVAGCLHWPIHHTLTNLAL